MATEELFVSVKLRINLHKKKWRRKKNWKKVKVCLLCYEFEHLVSETCQEKMSHSKVITQKHDTFSNSPMKVKIWNCLIIIIRDSKRFIASKDSTLSRIKHFINQTRINFVHEFQIQKTSKAVLFHRGKSLDFSIIFNT